MERNEGNEAGDGAGDVPDPFGSSGIRDPSGSRIPEIVGSEESEGSQDARGGHLPNMVGSEGSGAAKLSCSCAVGQRSAVARCGEGGVQRAQGGEECGMRRRSAHSAKESEVVSTSRSG